MNRQAVIIPENRQKIEKIRKKYNNMQISDDEANKIIKLEVTNNILKAATALVGVVTVIDFIVPDPVLGLDEIALASITGLLKGASSMVDNKIGLLAANQDASVQMDEITKLSKELGNVVTSVQNSRGNSR